jgi:hypothetical protein
MFIIYSTEQQHSWGVALVFRFQNIKGWLVFNTELVSTKAVNGVSYRFNTNCMNVGNKFSISC